MVRARDVARLLHLTRTIEELPADRAVRMRHVAEAACRLLGAKLGAVALGDGFQPQGHPRHTFAIGAGSIDACERAIFARYAAGDASADPCIPQLASRAQQISTLTRRRLVADARWYGSAHVSEDRRAAGVDDAIYSIRRTGPGGAAQLMAVHRPWGDKSTFTDRDATLLRLLHLAVAQKLDPPQPVSRPARLARQLSPRLRQVLGRLLLGESEQQIAATFELSRNTVHGYLKAIYAHFDVGSRGELLAHWVDVQAFVG